MGRKDGGEWRSGLSERTPEVPCLMCMAQMDVVI